MKKILTILILFNLSFSANAQLIDLSVTFRIEQIISQVPDPGPSNPVLGDVYTVYIQYDNSLEPVSPTDLEYFGAITEIDFSDLGFSGDYSEFMEFYSVGIINGFSRDTFAILMNGFPSTFKNNNDGVLYKFELLVDDLTASAITENDLSSDINFDLLTQGIVKISYIEGDAFPIITARMLDIAVVPSPSAIILFISSLGFLRIFRHKIDTGN